jgi:predicted XRE-type DNA-binding protein
VRSYNLGCTNGFYAILKYGETNKMPYFNMGSGGYMVRIKLNTTKEIKERLDICGHKIKHIAEVTDISQLRLSDLFHDRGKMSLIERDKLNDYLEVAEAAYMEITEKMKRYKHM